MIRQIKNDNKAWKSFARINFCALIWVFDRKESDWKIIENPPNEISPLIKLIDVLFMLLDNNFTPFVISTMPDIIPVESAVLSGVEPIMAQIIFDKNDKIFKLERMSIITKKNAI